MRHSIFWLSVSAFTRILARPIFYSNGLFTNTNPTLDSSSQFDSYLVAEKPSKPDKPPMTLEQLKERMKQILDDVYNGKYKDVVTDDLGELFDEATQEYLKKKLIENLSRPSGRLGEFLERTTSNGPETNREPGFSSDFTGEAGRRKWGETNPESGFSSDSTGGAGRQKWGPGDGAQESDQNPSTMQGLIQNPHPIPGLDVSSLIKFLTVVVNIAPQVDIELKGFALDEAIFEALPGFLGGIWGNWHPAGL